MNGATIPLTPQLYNTLLLPFGTTQVIWALSTPLLSQHVHPAVKFNHIVQLAAKISSPASGWHCVLSVIFNLAPLPLWCLFSFDVFTGPNKTTTTIEEISCAVSAVAYLYLWSWERGSWPGHRAASSSLISSHPWTGMHACGYSTPVCLAGLLLNKHSQHTRPSSFLDFTKCGYHFFLSQLISLSPPNFPVVALSVCSECDS